MIDYEDDLSIAMREMEETKEAMTEQEITQARADVDQLGIEQLRCGVMLQLLKIEALTKERDALNHLMGVRERQHHEREDVISDLRNERDTLTARLNVLEAAGKLALDALVGYADWEEVGDPHKPASEAIEALKKAGVQ